MIASATPEQYARAIEAVGADPTVDALVVIYVPPMVTEPEEIAAAIARGAGTVPAAEAGAHRLPLLARRPRGPGHRAARHASPPTAIPRTRRSRSPPPSATAAGAGGRGARCSSSAASRRARSGRSIDRVLAGGDEPRWLAPADLATVLRAAGIDVRRMASRSRPPSAEAAAERLGFPLVAKAVAPGLLHKSDVGGVVLGLESPAAVAAAVATLARAHARDRRAARGVLLQREVRGGIEALVGVTTDPTFGPLARLRARRRARRARCATSRSA